MINSYNNVDCVKVLEYMMSNVKSVVKAWRKRMYFYASASLFAIVAQELKIWLHPLVNRDETEVVAEDDEDPVDHEERRKRIKALFKVVDYQGMFQVVGDALLGFIAKKHNPFPNAVKSKESFLAIPPWRRAFTYINMVRYVTEVHANQHWFKYGYPNYKVNRIMFENYCTHDEKIVKASSSFQALRDEAPQFTPTKKKRKRRLREKFELSSPECATKQKRKIVCVLTESSDDDCF